MASLASVSSENASSVLLQALIREWTDQIRNLDQKHRDEIENLKAEKKNQLDAKVYQLEAKARALSKENEKLKTELATGSAVAVVNNMELLLKGLESRLNEKALKQETALQKSNIILESVNQKLEDNENKMQQHTMIVHDSIIKSAAIMSNINAQGQHSMDELKSLRFIQVLGDSTGTGSSVSWEMKVFVKSRRDEDKARAPFMYIHHGNVVNYSSFRYQMEQWGIHLTALRLVRVEVEETETAKRMPFKLGKWSMHAENFRRIEIS
ncbi:hypothetical protein FPQ18DRAFT_301991 [Pyronema domesticum]|nr:hypothetical protein FPQ18DRAFT_301991 [Pyronema domesticum]